MKNKVFTLMAIAAVSATLFVGCKKEMGPLVSFGTQIAQIGENGKIYMSGTNSNVPKYFTSGESVYINTEVKEITAQYRIEDVQASTTGYYAVYPSSIVVTNGTSTWIDGSDADNNAGDAYRISVKLPYLQTYDYATIDGSIVQKVNLPVGAVIPAGSNSKALDFYSLCSLVEVQWTNPTEENHTITSIEVTAAGKGLWGNGVATIDGTLSKVNVPYDTANSTVVLEIPNTIEGITYRETIAPNQSSRKYYVIVPPYDESTEFTVKINFDGGVKSLKYKRTGTIPNNSIIRIASDKKPGTNKEISGYFSVGTGKKVVFSKGNLQHHGDPTAGTWHFAKNQYDYFGNANYDVTSGEEYEMLSDSVDLFLWSIDCESQGNGMPAQTYGLRAVEEEDDYLQSGYLTDQHFADWGELTIDGDPANTWFTLSRSEWDYLLNRRYNASNLRYNVTITDIPYHSTGATSINGCLLFPDNWTNDRIPTGISFNTNNVTSLTYENFRRLEAAGCVLLPQAGYRDAIHGWIGVASSYKKGQYWTCNYSGESGGEEESYIMDYTYNSSERYASTSVSNDTRIIYGCSVRLVKPAPGYNYSDFGRTAPSK